MSRTIKGAILFIVLFLAAAVGITYFSIQKANNGVGTATAEEGIDLYGTYDENDLLVEEFAENYKDIEIKIPQINGLKNKEVLPNDNNA